MTELAPILVPVLARALACGAVVWLLIRAIDGAPPALSAWVISWPMTMAAGLLAIAGTQGDAFVARAAQNGCMSLPALLAFMLVAARLFERLRPLPLLAASLAAWLATTAAISATGPWRLGTSAAVLALCIGLSHLVLPLRPGFGPRLAAARRHSAWPPTLQAVAMVLLLSALAGWLGPLFSAWIAAAPMALCFVTLGLSRAGSRNAQATYQSARLGLPALFAYLATAAILTPRLGGTAATLAALLPSLGLSALIVAARLTLTPKEITP